MTICVCCQEHDGSSSKAADDPAYPQGGAGDTAAAVVNDLKISELAMGLEEERRTRMEEVSTINLLLIAIYNNLS